MTNIVRLSSPSTDKVRRAFRASVDLLDVQESLRQAAVEIRDQIRTLTKAALEIEALADDIDPTPTALTHGA